MSENNLKRDYERIWLTDELGEVNWCQDRITADDIEFVRADLFQSANAEVARMKAALLDIRDTLGVSMKSMVGGVMDITMLVGWGLGEAQDSAYEEFNKTRSKLSKGE